MKAHHVLVGAAALLLAAVLFLLSSFHGGRARPETAPPSRGRVDDPSALRPPRERRSPPPTPQGAAGMTLAPPPGQPSSGRAEELPPGYQRLEPGFRPLQVHKLVTVGTIDLGVHSRSQVRDEAALIDVLRRVGAEIDVLDRALPPGADRHDHLDPFEKVMDRYSDELAGHVTGGVFLHGPGWMLARPLGEEKKLRWK